MKTPISQYTIPEHRLSTTTFEDLCFIVSGDCEILTEIDLFDPHTLHFKGTYYYGIMQYMCSGYLLHDGVIGGPESDVHKQTLLNRGWLDFNREIVPTTHHDRLCCQNLLQMHPLIRKVTVFTNRTAAIEYFRQAQRNDPHFLTCQIQRRRYSTWSDITSAR